MSIATEDYLALIAPEHASKPNFVATVGLSADPLSRTQAVLEAMASVYFDLDAAIGPQLDAVGARVGISRFVPYPLLGLFFSFDDPIRGFDEGVWQGPFSAGMSIYQLDDDTFRRLIRAKILVNAWDGTIAGEEAIYNAYFTDPSVLVFVSDDAVSAQPKSYFSFDDPFRGFDQGQWAPVGAPQGAPSLSSVDMVITVGFAGKIPSVIDLAVLNEGLVGAKPEGVSVDYAVTSVSGAPLFGFDIESDFISGFDAGAWGVAPADLIGVSEQIVVPGALDFSMTGNSDLLPLL